MMLAGSEWDLDIGRAGIHQITLPNYRQLHSEVGYRLLYVFIGPIGV